MPTETLASDSNLRIRFTPPFRGKFRYVVEAEKPVTTFVVDREGLEAFESGEPTVRSYGGFSRRRLHKESVRPPLSDEFFFLIVNDNEEPVAVHYELDV
jgi:hypothetical protein